MKNHLTFLALVLLAVFANSTESLANAKLAKIRYGNSPMYGKTMEVISENRVSGRLTDFETTGGGGEDTEFVLACYEGAVKDVCDLLEIAVNEENDKQNLRGKKELKLSRCERNRYDAIIVDIESKGGKSLDIPNLSKCR